MRKVAITRSVIESLINNPRVAAAVPMIRGAGKALANKPNCKKCRQKQNIQAQAQLFTSIKATLSLLPKASLDIIKKELNADVLVIHSVDLAGQVSSSAL